MLVLSVLVYDAAGAVGVGAASCATGAACVQAAGVCTASSPHLKDLLQQLQGFQIDFILVCLSHDAALLGC